MEIVNVLFRFLHVGAAVVGIGGTILMRFVILPVLFSPLAHLFLRSLRGRVDRLLRTVWHRVPRLSGPRFNLAS